MVDMVFNNIDFTSLIKVEQIRRSVLPPQIINSYKIPGKIGNKFSKVDMGTALIEVDIRLIEKTRMNVQDKARELAGLLHATEPKELHLRDEPTRYNLAILSDSTNLEKFLFTGFTTLNFLCVDPLAYSKEKNMIELGPSTTILNSGTYEASGIITVYINSSVSYLEALLLESGEKVYIGENFVAGEIVIIDLENELVKKNDNLIMNKVHVISDFFKLPVGEFTINLSSGTGILEFRKAWL